MNKGFQPVETDQTKVQIIVKRLTPSIQRQDRSAFRSGLVKMTERYGHGPAQEALRLLFNDSEWLRQIATQLLESSLPEDLREELTARSIEIIANSLEEAGLRLEDNMRVSDQGIAFSKEAVAAIVATGYPEAHEFGEGNDSLDGLGLCRSPYMHHLAETTGDGQFLNCWGVASLVINASLGWFDDPPDDPAVPRRNLERFVRAASPTVDIEKMLFRSRYDDRALLKLAQLVGDGFTALAKRAVEDGGFKVDDLFT